MTPLNQKQQSSLEQLGAEPVREQDKIQLILAYASCLSLIPWLTVKDSAFVQWHAKQGVVLNIGGALALTILTFIPIMQLAGCLAGPGLLVLDVLAIMRALKGERWRIPIVAELADKL